jgi:hypothetical protein
LIDHSEFKVRQPEVFDGRIFRNRRPEVESHQIDKEFLGYVTVSYLLSYAKDIVRVIIWISLMFPIQSRRQWRYGMRYALIFYFYFFFIPDFHRVHVLIS